MKRGSTITWRRTVGGPELYNVTFYGSTDGDNFTPLGQGTRVPGTGNWQLSGLTIPANTNYYVGARSIGVSGQVKCCVLHSNELRQGLFQFVWQVHL